MRWSSALSCLLLLSVVNASRRVAAPQYSEWVQREGGLRAQLLDAAPRNAPLGEHRLYSYDRYAIPTPVDFEAWWRDFVKKQDYWVRACPWCETKWHVFRNMTSLPSRMSATGMNVSMTVQVQDVVSEDMPRRTVDFALSLTMRWTDQRLRWNSTKWGLFSTVLQVGASGNDIFTPEIGLLSSGQSLATSLSGGVATVDHNGGVLWSRQGVVTADCGFSLADFPFDSTTCTLLFGANSFIGIQADGASSKACVQGNPSISRGSPTQVSVESVACSTKPAMPGSFEVTIKLQRVWQAFWLRVMVPELLLTILSFAAFFCSAGSRERVTYGVALLVGHAALEATVSSQLPIVANTSFLLTYMRVSAAYSFVALLESIFVAVLFFKTDSNLTPEWFQRFYAGLCLKLGIETAAANATGVGTAESNQALDDFLATRGSLSNNPKMHMNLQETVTMEEVMNGGTNLELNPALEAKAPTTGLHGAGLMRGGASRAVARQGESLSDWLKRTGYDKYEAVIRRNGIKSVADLAECYLTEEDLESDFEMHMLLPRRRFLAHLKALTGEQKLKKNPMEAIVQQLQDGLVGHGDVALTFDGGGKLSKSAPKGRRGAATNEPEDKGPSAEEKAARQQELVESVQRDSAAAICRYWQQWARRIDVCAQLACPLVFGLHMYLLLAPHISVIGQG